MQSMLVFRHSRSQKSRNMSYRNSFSHKLVGILDSTIVKEVNGTKTQYISSCTSILCIFGIFGSLVVVGLSYFFILMYYLTILNPQKGLSGTPCYKLIHTYKVPVVISWRSESRNVCLVILDNLLIEYPPA